MAIGVQPTLQYEPVSWGLKHSVTYTLDYPEVVIDTMSYQYPALPHSGDIPHSSYIPSFSGPTSSSIEGTCDTAHKSVSHGGEKKRNKLGYHRASIACLHCRNRKIRCIAPDKRDVQGQCKSCENLKRECIYENVDQRSSAVPGQRQGSVRSSTGVRIDPNSLSPTLGHHQSYQQLPSTSPVQSMGVHPVKQESYPEDHRISTDTPGARTFGYGQGMTHWIPAESNTGSVKMVADVNIPLRNYSHESPVASSFPPYSAQPSQTSATWHAAPLAAPSVGTEPTSRAEDVWSSYPPPARIASYGSEPSSHYLPSTRPYERRAPIPSDMYHYPHVTTSMEGIPHPGTPVDPRASDAVPTPAYSTWQQPYQYNKGGDSYGGWYGGQ